MESKAYVSENIIKSECYHQQMILVNQNDVLCGRGKYAQLWHGNIFYRDLIHRNKLEYIIGDAFEKDKIAKSIVKNIRKLNPPGRFLKLKESENTYFDIGDKKACHKVKQSLREGSNILLTQITPFPFDNKVRSKIEDDNDYIELLSMLRDKRS